MDCESLQQYISQSSLVDVTSAIAAFSAIIAAASAFRSYGLSKEIYNEIKSDEVVITGPLHYPDLSVQEHKYCVLRCTLFNKSKRKTYISSVEAFDIKGKKIEITWSDSIDSLGNIQTPTGLLGLEDSVNLVLRRNDGESFKRTKVSVKHSFSSDVLFIEFNLCEGFAEQN